MPSLWDALLAQAAMGAGPGTEAQWLAAKVAAEKKAAAEAYLRGRGLLEAAKTPAARRAAQAAVAAGNKAALGAAGRVAGRLAGPAGALFGLHELNNAISTPTPLDPNARPTFNDPEFQGAAGVFADWEQEEANKALRGMPFRASNTDFTSGPEKLFGSRDSFVPQVDMPLSVSQPLPQPAPGGFEPAPGGRVTSWPDAEDMPARQPWPAGPQAGPGLSVRDLVNQVAAGNHAETMKQFPPRPAGVVAGENQPMGGRTFNVPGAPVSPDALAEVDALLRDPLAAKQARMPETQLDARGRPMIMPLNTGTFAKRPEPRTQDEISAAFVAGLDERGRAAYETMKARAASAAGLPAGATGPERDLAVRQAIARNQGGTLERNQDMQRARLNERLAAGKPINEVAAARLGITSMPLKPSESEWNNAIDTFPRLAGVEPATRPQAIPASLQAIATSRAARQPSQRVQDSRFLDSVTRDVRLGRMPPDVARELVAERLASRFNVGGGDLANLAMRNPEAARILAGREVEMARLAQEGNRDAQKAVEFNALLGLKGKEFDQRVTEFSQTHGLDELKVRAEIADRQASGAREDRKLGQADTALVDTRVAGERSDANTELASILSAISGTVSPEALAAITQILASRFPKMFPPPPEKPPAQSAGKSPVPGMGRTSPGRPGVDRLAPAFTGT